MKKVILAAGAITAIALVAILREEFAVKPNQAVEVLRASFRQIEKLPDPTNINTAGKWYFLNHISSPLIEYNHKNASFLPLIAKNWDIVGSKYTFRLDPGAKFSDGSPIRARDVVASLKRIHCRPV